MRTFGHSYGYRLTQPTPLLDIPPTAPRAYNRDIMEHSKQLG